MSITKPTDVDPTAGSLEQEMTAISLEQALQDFEIANARVIDLATRLVTVSAELDVAEQQLDALMRDRDDAIARAAAAEHALASFTASRSVRAALLGARMLRRLTR